MQTVKSTHRGKTVCSEDIKEYNQKNLTRDLPHINDNDNKDLSQINYFDHQRRGY